MPSREPPERFPVSFYVVAMLFIMFDIEIIFVYPYAVAHGDARRVRVRGDRDLLGAVLPRRSCTRSPAAVSTGARCSAPATSTPTPRMVSPSARCATTIRRVGTEGREQPEEAA